ncbi:MULTISPECIES: enoyl-CoA hydratase [Pseudomonas]|uniref:enoyl-CoA hydratase n=1 Tax=Pseudomonas nitroreducens TaxID=46680 RepID=UPI001E5E342A|nr:MULTISPECIES: enoyl-CoA hydratase [Pseudomonas]MCE4071491.1 enoyl-CoA hydratase [Pseudomonas nitritireducens]MCE4081267.1 enoyl-CoA hydratase [Pseudomonas nitroreducens]
MSEVLLLEKLEDGVLTLTLNRPERLNALNPPLLRTLREGMERASRNHAARVVVITGAGRAFCAGGDIAGKPEKKAEESSDAAPAPRKERAPDNVASRIDWLRGNMEAVRLLYQMDKPTIAMIRGATVSVGMALAAACDFRVVSENASFTTGFAKVGFSGDYGASYFLTRLLGSAKTRELMFLSDMLDANEAQRIGLVSRLVADADLEAQTQVLARRLADGPPLTYRFMKKNLNAAVDGSLEQILDMEATHMVLSSLTSDQREAVKAFMEKRKPQFSGT